jgi:hypothetical protein
MVQDLCQKALANGTKEVEDSDVFALADIARAGTATQYANACAAYGKTVVNGRCQ